MDDELGPTQRWVATSESGRSAATALLVRELRRAHVFVLGAVLLAVLVVVLLVLGRAERDRQPLFVVTFSLAMIAFLVGTAVGLSYLQRVRAMTAQLPAGLEMTTRFGPDHLVLTRPWASSRLHFDGYAALEVVRGWVMLKRRGTRTWVLIPEPLVPPQDLARLRLVIAGYRPRPPQDPDETPDA